MDKLLNLLLTIVLTNGLGVVLYCGLFSYSFKRRHAFMLRLCLSLLAILGLDDGDAGRAVYRLAEVVGEGAVDDVHRPRLVAKLDRDRTVHIGLRSVAGVGSVLVCREDAVLDARAAGVSAQREDAAPQILAVDSAYDTVAAEVAAAEDSRNLRPDRAAVERAGERIAGVVRMGGDVRISVAVEVGVDDRGRGTGFYVQRAAVALAGRVVPVRHLEHVALEERVGDDDVCASGAGHLHALAILPAGVEGVNAVLAVGQHRAVGKREVASAFLDDAVAEAVKDLDAVELDRYAGGV